MQRKIIVFIVNYILLYIIINYILFYRLIIVDNLKLVYHMPSVLLLLLPLLLPLLITRMNIRVTC